MIEVPAQHQTDPSKKPGQIVFPIIEDQDEPNTVPNPEFINMNPPHSLGEYLEKKYPEEMKKKLSFEEWLRKSSFVIPDETIYEWLQDCWKAAQENK